MSNRYATFASNGYQLDNAESQFLAHPETFDIPEREERTRLAFPCFVKLAFLFPPNTIAAKLTEHGSWPNGERMWVLLYGPHVDDAPVYQGVLSNDPAFFDAAVLASGSLVLFGPEHIIDIDRNVDVETAMAVLRERAKTTGAPTFWGAPVFDDED